MKIQEGHLEFKFPTNNDSRANQYDEWSFYRNQFIKVTEGTKAVDFVYIDKVHDVTWLIEVKDYRHPDTELIKPSELAGIVAQKVRGSLVGLAAARCNANNPQERALSEAEFKTNKSR